LRAAFTAAQRAETYREREKAGGLTAVNCYLPPGGRGFQNTLKREWA